MLAVRDALAGIRLILRYILNKSHLEYPYLSFCPSVLLSFCPSVVFLSASDWRFTSGTSWNPCDEPVRSLLRLYESDHVGLANLNNH